MTDFAAALYNGEENMKPAKFEGVMDNQIYNQIVNFIWGIADDCLRDIYVRSRD